MFKPPSLAKWTVGTFCPCFFYCMYMSTIKVGIFIWYVHSFTYNECSNFYWVNDSMSPLSNCRPFSSSQGKNLYPLLVTLHPSFPQSLATTNLFSLYIVLPLFGVCNWLLESYVFSRFVHVVACISTSFLCFVNNPLCGCAVFCIFTRQLKDVLVVFIFWLLWIMLLWTYKYKFLCGFIFLFLLSI
jgi:hypothetical protein